MELVTPSIGLIFWMTLSFLILLFILGKFAWKPIMKSLKDREETIAQALNLAEEARAEIGDLKAENERLAKDAKDERDKLLREARDVRDRIIDAARLEAKQEGARLMEITRTDIRNEILAARTDLKNEIAALSVMIAEKLVKDELQDKKKSEALVNKLLDEVKWN
ncbi:MAG: F0F1 ATP synthase subunit B [Bacteroidetes bacterium]|nr:F0F1 ATP synthase subunit B [Bacteroidota bacterium]